MLNFISANISVGVVTCEQAFNIFEVFRNLILLLPQALSDKGLFTLRAKAKATPTAIKFLANLIFHSLSNRKSSNLSLVFAFEWCERIQTIIRMSCAVHKSICIKTMTSYYVI